DHADADHDHADADAEQAEMQHVDHSGWMIKNRFVMADETETQKSGTTEGLSRLAQIAGKVVAPVTITALMVYFGWVRTRTTYEIFGISDSVLGFSVQDYLFRSISQTFEPLALLLLLILVAIPTHLGLIKLMRARGWRKRLVLPLAVTGMASTVVGLLGFLDVVTYSVAWPLIPMSLGLGVLLIGYATALWRAAGGTVLQPLGDSDVIDIVTRVAFTTFLILTMFWSVAISAQIRGFEDAQHIAQGVASLPGVVVFAPHPLHLRGGEIRETVLIGDQESRYYRYDGLRLLVRASGGYILLPANWRPGMRTIVLRDNPDIRLEFYLG
ncbi:MAG: hypothetical protein WCF33_09535, partial [Pseudonocardiaceae bacterium]